jgi:RNA polymerase sigma factor (sigma-70 family)
LSLQYNDQEIIECLISGSNGKVLEFLYDAIFPKIKSYVLNNSGKSDDALDIFQDALVILCKQIKLGKFDAQYQISGYLYTVSRNLWINKAKKNRRVQTFAGIIEISETEDFSDLIITREKEKVLREITEKLGEKCYDLLKHAVFHQTSTEEIIELMGFSTANALKTQKYKCKQKLFKILEENPEYKEAID